MLWLTGLLEERRDLFQEGPCLRTLTDASGVLSSCCQSPEFNFYLLKYTHELRKLDNLTKSLYHFIMWHILFFRKRKCSRQVWRKVVFTEKKKMQIYNCMQVAFSYRQCQSFLLYSCKNKYMNIIKARIFNELHLVSFSLYTEKLKWRSKLKRSFDLSKIFDILKDIELFIGLFEIWSQMC